MIRRWVASNRIFSRIFLVTGEEMGKNPVSKVCEPQMSADIRAMDADEFR
jgi:hypothetical protein